MKNHLKKVFYSGIITFAMIFVAALGLFFIPTLHGDEKGIVYAEPTDEYVVSYDANGGNGTMVGASVLEGGEFTLASCDFTAEGKRFAGWGINTQTPATGDIKRPNDTIIITEQTTIYALWINVYRVAYDANAEEYTGEMQDAEVDDGTLFPLDSCAFVVSGEAFAGWAVGSVDATPLKQHGDTIEVTSNVVVYAIWADTHKVYYHPNGGSGEMVSFGNYAEGAVVELKTAEECGFEAPENHEFAGWRVGDETKQPGDEITIGEDDTFVNAIWEMTRFTISFNAGDGGVGEDVSVERDKNSTYSLPTNIFTPDGKKHFVGWLVKGETKQPRETITITEDLQITALWVTYFDVYFDQNGATGTMQKVEVDEGNKLTLPTPTFTPPTGKKFKDWVLGTTHYNAGVEVDIMEDNTHIYPYWIDIVVRKTFDLEQTKVGVNVTTIFALTKENEQEVEFTVAGHKIIFNNEAVQSIGGKSTNFFFDFSTEVKDTNINGAREIIDISLSGDAFTDGSVMIIVPVDAKVANRDNVKVYYLAEDGKKTDMLAIYVDGNVTFTTDHFSRFVYVLTDGGGIFSAWNIILIVLAGIAVVGLAVLALYAAKVGTRNKSEEE